MRCPFCGADDTQVKDSRPTDDRSAIRRRRFCPNCAARFTTFERVQLRELTVIKKNGQREAFDRDKLAKSVYTALRKRPVETETVERVINSLVRQLESAGETEISGMAKQGLDHPSSKPVLAGAAIGAVAGALLPVISLPIGALVGAGFAFYNRIKK